MRDDEQTNKQTVKIELLSQWKLEAEFCNCGFEVCEDLLKHLRSPARRNQALYIITGPLASHQITYFQKADDTHHVMTMTKTHPKTKIKKKKTRVKDLAFDIFFKMIGLNGIVFNDRR